MIYLDNAATTIKKPDSVMKKMYSEIKRGNFNAGRGMYKKSIEASLKMIETAEEIADLFNIDDISTIAFTQNASYAVNMLILGYVLPEDHVIITGMEHNSVLRPVYRLGNFTVVNTDEAGNINLKEIEYEAYNLYSCVKCMWND